MALIKRVVKENLTWGAERIRGELLKLGVEISKSTIQRYIKEERESRSSKQTWATFLRNHASQIWACDFLQTYDVFFCTVFVFVIIELGSRCVVHFGITRNPTDQWTAQQLREATPFGEGPRFLIRDNDYKFGPLFARVAKGTGIEVLRTPYRAPKANAIYVQRSLAQRNPRSGPRFQGTTPRRLSPRAQPAPSFQAPPLRIRVLVPSRSSRPSSGQYG